MGFADWNKKQQVAAAAKDMLQLPRTLSPAKLILTVLLVSLLASCQRGFMP